MAQRIYDLRNKLRLTYRETDNTHRSSPIDQILGHSAPTIPVEIEENYSPIRNSVETGVLENSKKTENYSMPRTSSFSSNIASSSKISVKSITPCSTSSSSNPIPVEQVQRNLFNFKPRPSKLQRSPLSSLNPYLANSVLGSCRDNDSGFNSTRASINDPSTSIRTISISTNTDCDVSNFTGADRSPVDKEDEDGFEILSFTSDDENTPKPVGLGTLRLSPMSPMSPLVDKKLFHGKILTRNRRRGNAFYKKNPRESRNNSPTPEVKQNPELGHKYKLRRGSITPDRSITPSHISDTEFSFESVTIRPRASSFHHIRHKKNTTSQEKYMVIQAIQKAEDARCRSTSLIGDFSGNCSIPTTTGKHPDLSYIEPQTLVNMIAPISSSPCVTPSTRTTITSEFQGQNIDFRIIDCRYPYEFNGGSIRSAINIYGLPALINEIYEKTAKKSILIFHCEFSSERAPRLLRALRKHDREQHPYPELKFPECYLLKDGYKSFFAKFPQFCLGKYTPMTDSSYTEDYKKFRRGKSATWCGETRSKAKARVISRIRSKI